MQTLVTVLGQGYPTTDARAAETEDRTYGYDLHLQAAGLAK